MMDSRTLRLVLGGLKSYFPTLHTGDKGVSSRPAAAYCYSVWMRHLSLITKAVPSFRPRAVVELGPGETLGVGCAALLSGAEQYVGLDHVARADPRHDVQVLDELVEMFAHHAPIPDERVFPHLLPKLSAYNFPNRLFADDGPRHIRIEEDRVQSIRGALLDRQDVLYDNVPVGYVVPWGMRTLDRQSVDLVFSQASLQTLTHDADGSELAGAFAAMSRWLRKGGLMSHQVDFGFPVGPEWNHHWHYPETAWRVLRGNRQAFVNRVPLSVYLQLCDEYDFQVVSVKRVERPGMPREQAAPRFRDLPEADYTTSSAHIVAVRR